MKESSASSLLVGDYWLGLLFHWTKHVLENVDKLPNYTASRYSHRHEVLKAYFNCTPLIEALS
jgi:hypothetical protein